MGRRAAAADRARPTSRAPASWPRATRAPPGRSAWRWSPRVRAPPTWSPRCATAWPIPFRMVVICGQVPRAAIGSDAFQEAPDRLGHGRGGQACVPGHRAREARGARSARRSSSRARAGRARWWSTFRRTCRTGRARSRARACCRPSASTRSACSRSTARRLPDAQLESFFSLLGECAASADLCRRRRDQCRAPRRSCASSRETLRHSRGHHADGHRRGRHRSDAAVHAHARHAWHGLRQLRGARTAIS